MQYHITFKESEDVPDLEFYWGEREPKSYVNHDSKIVIWSLLDTQK
jgi:hypothetical protein